MSLELIKLKQIENGGGDKNYIHDQFNTSATWTIQHSLNKICSIQIYASGGSRIYGEVIYNGLSEIIVQFSQPISGMAICN